MSVNPQLQALRGKYVHYISNKGKSKIGLLHHFEFDRRRSCTVAVIMKSGTSLTSPRMERINLSQILPKSFQSSGSNGAIGASTIRNPSGNIMNGLGLSYGGVNYSEGSHSEFKIGDEVVWTTEIDGAGRGNNLSPFIGKIRWIGVENFETARGAINYVAVVQFDESTKHLPKYIPFPPSNRNIVDFKDILHLEIWLQLQASLTESPVDSKAPSSSLVFREPEAPQNETISQNNLIDLFDDAPLPSQNTKTGLSANTTLAPDVENVWQQWLRDIENTNRV